MTRRRRQLAPLFAAALAASLAAYGGARAAPPGHGAQAPHSSLSPAPEVRRPQLAEQSGPPLPPKRPSSGAEPRDPNCPGTDNKALMCRLVNEYRAKNGLKPVQLDAAVSRQSQYWSDQLKKRYACWFLHHDSNYHARMRAAFPGRRFRENAACSGFEEGGAKYILERWINSAGHRQNMLTPEWKTIGVGVTDNIWVINFTN